MVEIGKTYLNKPAAKLSLAIYGAMYFVTVALFVIGILFGLQSALMVMAVILFLILISAAALVAGPMLKARRIFSKNPPLKMYESISSREDYCRLEDISRWFLLAVKCGEDHMFFNHKGIDYNSLFSAVASDIFDKKSVGGSTITQQLIKNIYLTHEKTVNRKICELLMVKRVEKELGKNRIFELYVNVIYYGFDKYGISAAAGHYYGCRPSELTFDQSLSLAAILPCPDKYNSRANPVYFYQVRQSLLRRILSFSGMTFKQLAQLYNEN